MSHFKRLSNLKNRGNWEERWQRIADYILPRKAEVTTKRARGESRVVKLYDSTAIHANELLGASLQGTLTPSSALWFGIQVEDEELREDQEVKEWCGMAAEKMFSAINNSNFRSESHENYLDMGSVGIATLLCEENQGSQEQFNGLMFKSFFISNIYPAENQDGMVDTVFRKFEWTARQAELKWGRNKLSEKLRDKIKDKPDEMHEFLHVVEPRDKKGKAKKNMPFASYYYEVETKHLLEEGGYKEFPYAVPRWSKASGEKYARSPGFTAIPDIRTLNRAVELELKAWAKDIDPPLGVPDEGVGGKLKLTPAAQNYIRADLIDKIRPLLSNSRYDVTQLKVQDLRTSIRQIFMSDQLQMQQGPQMTATEVQVRFELMQRLIGPTLGRMEMEYLKPILNRVFNIMLRKNALGVIPEILQGNEVNVKFIGPVARAQRLNEIAAIERWIGSLIPVSQVNPDILDCVDFDRVAEETATLYGVPDRLQRSPEEKDALRQQRAQQMAQQQALQTAMEGTKAIKNIADADRE